MIERRGFLGLVGGGAAGAGLAGCGIDLRPLVGNGSQQTAELLRSAAPSPPPFTVALPVPPVRRPVGGLIEVVQQVAEAEILPGLRTAVLGYDGIFPGPTIESRRGEPVRVRHRNELPVPTVVHLHGGHTPPEHDGWPMDLLLPAGSRDWDGGPAPSTSRCPSAAPISGATAVSTAQARTGPQPSSAATAASVRGDLNAPGELSDPSPGSARGIQDIDYRDPATLTALRELAAEMIRRYLR